MNWYLQSQHVHLMKAIEAIVVTNNALKSQFLWISWQAAAGQAV